MNVSTIGEKTASDRNPTSPLIGNSGMSSLGAKLCTRKAKARLGMMQRSHAKGIASQARRGSRRGFGK
jgi:hypothetical protein